MRCPVLAHSADDRDRRQDCCYFQACGRDGRCDTFDSCVDPTTQNAVRCCSDTEISNWDQRNEECPWTESDVGQGWDCQGDMTWSQANVQCTDVGGRLCTLDEIDCARGTGCGFDTR